MHVRYTTTVEDLEAVARFYADVSPTLRKQMRQASLGVAVVVLAVCGALDLLAHTLRWTPYALLFGVVYVSLYPRLYRSSLVRLTREVALEGKNATTLCEHTLEATPETLVERTPVGESRLAWHAIERIGRTDTHAFIFTQPNAAHAIPRHRLAEGNFDEFVSAAERAFTLARSHVADR